MTHASVRPVAAILAVFPVYHVIWGMSLLAGGDPIAGSAMVLVGGLAAVFLVAFAVDPDRAQRAFARPVGARLDDGTSVAGYFLQVAVVYTFFGFFTVVQGAFLVESFLRTGENPAAGVTIEESALLANQFVIFLVLVVGTLSWYFMVEQRTAEGTARGLGLLPLRPVENAAGVFVGAVAYVVFLLIVAYGLHLSGAETPTNPQADALAAALSPMGVVALSVMAGVGEELYFRGLVQRKVGNLFQAFLFGIVHISYLTPWQVAIPFVVGYGFGLLRNRVGLWAPIILHTGFDLFAFFGRELADGSELVALLPF